MNFICGFLLLLSIFTLALAKPAKHSLEKSTVRTMEEKWVKSRSINHFLIKYMETKYPNRSEQEKTKMILNVVQKIKSKMMKKQMKKLWAMKEDQFARILK